MYKHIEEPMENLGSANDKIRMDAVQNILDLTDNHVSWIYHVWDALLEKLNHPNSYQRSIGIKVLCNLAKSDSENRLDDL